MKFEKAITDNRTAKEVIENSNTDEDLRILLGLAIKKDGPNITPTQERTWEKSITTERHMLLLWYAVPDKDYTGHVVGINKDTKKSLGQIKENQLIKIGNNKT
jgi:hypothetical protein